MYVPIYQYPEQKYNARPVPSFTDIHSSETQNRDLQPHCVLSHLNLLQGTRVCPSKEAWRPCLFEVATLLCAEGLFILLLV